MENMMNTVAASFAITAAFDRARELLTTEEYLTIRQTLNRQPDRDEATDEQIAAFVTTHTDHTVAWRGRE